MKFGRWNVTEERIETKKENDEIIAVHKTDLWDYDTNGNINHFSNPVDICLYNWLSNTDILDFNSAFLYSLEHFSKFKLEQIPISISWKETLIMQYKRINKSLDINSYEGKTKCEQRGEYFSKESIENLLEQSKINSTDDFSKHKEIVGDKNSRTP